MRWRRDVLDTIVPGRWLPVFAAAAIGTHALAAWCNAGFLNADEHYQIIEFAQYKLGYQTAAALAWEFPARMRPALQPWIASVAIRLHHLAGITSPFDIALSLRVLSAILALLVSLEICVRCLPAIATPSIRRAALLASFFLWIAPTVHARFSSENWSGALLAGGLCLLLDALDSPDRRRSLSLTAAAGLVWSAAFYCRFQVGIAIVGAMLWLALVRRSSPALIATLASAFVVGCLLNEGLDRWLYGEWALVPANYFRINLTEGKAATFGTRPWWMELVYLAVVLVPPYSLAAIAALAIGSWYARRHVLVWMAVPFVVVHMALARKEPRFLIPLLYLLGPWLGICADRLVQRFAWLRRHSFSRAHVAVFSAINVVALAVATTIPGNDSIRFDEWRWHQQRAGVTTLFAIAPPKSGLPVNVTNSFYGSDVPMTPFTASDAAAHQGGPPVFVYYTGIDAPPPLTAACTPVLRSFPPWLVTLPLFTRATNVQVSTVCRY